VTLKSKLWVISRSLENGTIWKLEYGFLFAFHCTVTMALSCIVSEIKRAIGRKSRIFSYPLAFEAPVKRVPVGISPWRLVWENYTVGHHYRTPSFNWHNTNHTTLSGIVNKFCKMLSLFAQNKCIIDVQRDIRTNRHKPAVRDSAVKIRATPSPPPFFKGWQHLRNRLYMHLSRRLKFTAASNASGVCKSRLSANIWSITAGSNEQSYGMCPIMLTVDTLYTIAVLPRKSGSRIRWWCKNAHKCNITVAYSGLPGGGLPLSDLHF